MAKEQVWMVTSGEATMISSDFTIKEKLPLGIYNVNLVPFRGWVLEPYAEKFEFDYKLYDLQSDFVNHVCKTYESTAGNLGVLLNGTKGTGKTVTAKELANKLNIPVIIVKSFGENNQDLIEYLSSINTDCVLFFDEFEKNFSENDSTILQIMDGVYNSSHRRVFLLTTNTMDINDNLIGRPSRIRYVKTFGNLDLRVVKAYLDDNLEDKSCASEVIEFIDSLTISTIDIVKTIVNEINIHGIESFRHSKSFFNVKSTTYNYQVYMSDINPRIFIEDQQKPTKAFTLDRFMELVKKKQEWEDSRIYRYSMSQEEFDKKCQIFEDYRRTSPFPNIYYKTFDSADKFSVLHEGSSTEWGTVIKVDKDKNVIVTQDTDLDYPEENSIRFIYFINPNAKPSLYNKDRLIY